MDRPTLQQLAYLVALADTGHFGRAADACFVTQPALSTQVRALERRLGTVLVERLPRGIRFTPAGEGAVTRARRVLRDVEELMEEVGATEGELVGPGVQGNHYGLTDHDLFVFDIYDIDKGEYLCPAERNILVNYLELNPVPSVGGIILKDTTVDMLIEMADGYSVINGAKRREGLVFKKHNASFKSVSNAYLLGEK